jgi:outer membrane receptor for ferric coprogen and ferric-rhodotorulic acid
VIIEGIDVGVAGALVQETGTSSGATPISIRPMPMASSRASASAPQTPANLFKMAMSYTVPKTRWTFGSNVQYRGDIFAEGLNWFIPDTLWRIEQDGVWPSA